MSGPFINSTTAQFNAKVNDAMTKVARFIPFVMLLYGLLVQVGFIHGSDFNTWQGFIAIVAVMAIAGFTQDDNFYQSPIRQFSYYFIFLTFCLFVTGMPSVLLVWTPLSITTVFTFNLRVYWWSNALLLVFCLFDSFLGWSGQDVGFQNGGIPRLAEDITLAVLTAISSYIVITLILAQMTDHTSLIKTRRRESLQYSRMQALVNSMNDAILSVDNKGSIKLYNSAALSLLDTNRNLSNHHLDDILKLYDTKGKRANLFELMTVENRIFSLESLSHRFADGEQIRLGITGAPIRTSYGKSQNAKEGYIFIIRDITKSKSLEEERDEFISVISHELRTPITITEAALSNVQILAQKEKAGSEIIKGLGDAHDEILYLAKMINDLSALSRAERTVGFESEEVDVKELMQGLYNDYLPQATDHQLMLNLDIGTNIGTITTNKLYLEEVLQNFITNAIKYTSKGSITLHVSKVSRGVQFAVADTGSGISKSDRNKVFEKFYRSEDYRTRETSGTGLGLYVAQKLAGKLGTHIELNSRLHHGSTFSFILPT